jgi:hypothetical protein
VADNKLRGVRTESLESGRPEMQQTLDRAKKFLNLVALLAALLAAVAVGIAARDYAQRHLDDCAMLRVLGTPQRAMAGAYALSLGVVGLIASVGGVALGFAVHFVFVSLLSGLLDAQLPPATAMPALFGLGVGMTLLVAFGLPPVLQLARVPPLRVIRRDLGQPRAASAGVLIAGTAGFAALLVAASSDLRMGLLAVGGFAAAVAVFAVLAWGAVWLLRRLVPQAGAARWLGLATRQLAARPALVVLQVSALAVGLLALMLLVLLRTDLISAWRAATPPDAPNRFVINLQPEQGEAFQATLKAGRRGPLRLVPDDPRPPAVHQRHRGGTWPLHRRPRPAPGRARVQPEPRRAAAGTQPAGRRRLGARRGRRPERGRRPGHHAGAEAGRHAHLRHRRHPEERPRHQPAQGGLGVDAGELLRDVPAVAHGRRAFELHQRLPRARHAGLRPGAGAAVSQPDQCRPVGQPGAGAEGAGPGDPRGGVSLRLHPGRWPGGAVCRRQRHPREPGA